MGAKTLIQVTWTTAVVGVVDAPYDYIGTMIPRNLISSGFYPYHSLVRDQTLRFVNQLFQA
jgi:hypothetical protein